MNSIGQSSVFQPKRVTASSAVGTKSAVELTCEIGSHSERFVSQEMPPQRVSPELQPPCIASREQAAAPELQNWPIKMSTIPNASQSFTSCGGLGWQVSENYFPNSGSTYATGMNASLGMNAGLGMGSKLGAHAAYIPSFISSTSIPSRTWNWGWADQAK